MRGSEANQEHKRKRLSTITAKAALLGAVVIETEGDFGEKQYIATLGAATKAFDCLEDLEHWLSSIKSGASTEVAA